MGVPVLVRLFAVTKVTKHPNQPWAGLLDRKQFPPLNRVPADLPTETRRCLAQRKEPFVPIYRRIQRESVVTDRPTPLLHRPSRIRVVVGKRHHDVPTRDPDQLGERLVQVVEVLEHVRTQHKVEVPIRERQALLLQIHNQIRRATHIDTDVVQTRNQLFQVGAVTPNVEDPPPDEGPEAVRDETGASLPILDRNNFTMHDG